ncbi:hypothetical protein LOK55_08965 [Microbacterium sp. F2E]|uniref:hypothetical protein n=1 Tax=Microbacterium sp. F2E TaxID=2895284 RepID=UPI001E61906E|nr:hypothetical protein [Microbacterium sp. F2E]MCC9054416.1 hypothetical protein [Microbacterium sp. F2E]
MSIETQVDDHVATVVARSHTHATIWGAEGTWRLELRLEYLRTPPGWVAQRTIASTW